MSSLFPILLVAALQGQPIDSDVSESALSGFIASRAPKNYSENFRARFALQYAGRILVEAKRRNLNPIILTAIAWTESDFRPWVKGQGTDRRAGEVGVWQLIPGDFSIVEGEKTLAGCPAPSGLSPTAAAQWRRRAAAPDAKCEAPEVAAERKRPGWFYAYELVNPVVGTYLAAFEIRSHIDSSIARGVKPRKIPGCKLDLEKQKEIYRYGHFNSGSALPKTVYLQRLCRRYAAVAEFITLENLRAKAGSNGGPRDGKIQVVGTAN